MSGLRIVTVCLMILSLVSCAGFAPRAVEPSLTPVEIEQIQTRHFSAAPPDVFKSTVGALQGLGYIIDNANMDAGFLTAATPRQVIQKDGRDISLGSFFAALFVGALLLDDGHDDGYRYGRGSNVPADKVTRYVRLSAHVRQQADSTRLRLSLVEVRDRASGRGQTSGIDTPIYDKEVYRSIFERIEDELFVDQGLP